MKMKRNLAVILALVLAISLLAPAAVFAAASDTYTVNIQIKGPNKEDVEKTASKNYTIQAGNQALKTLIVTWAGNAESVVATDFAGTNLRADFNNFVAKAQGDSEAEWIALFDTVTIDKADAVDLLKDRANTQLYQLEQYSPIKATYITGGKTYTVTMTLTVDTYEEEDTPTPAPETETETVTGEDGTTAEVAKDEEGNVSEIKVDVADDVTETTVPVETSAEDDVIYDIDIPDGKTCIVTIPLDEVTPTTVVKLIKADGTEEILPITAMTEEGLKLMLDEDVKVKVEEVEVDNGIADDAWYKEAMDYVYARDIVEDIPTEDVEPLEDCDRGTFTMMLYNMCRQPDAEGDSEFEDVDSEAFYNEAVAWARENNIIKGTSETTFDGDEPITREQIMTILWRYVGGPEAPAVDTGASDWAADAMSWAVSIGLIQGYGDGSGYHAKDAANIAEAATIIMRFINNMYAGPSV